MEVIALFLSVLIGLFAVLGLKPKSDHLSYLLTFSGAYLLSITILHLLPEVYHNHNVSTISLLVLLGLVFQMILDFFSKGIEHGHAHAEDFRTFPYGLFISLIIHSFMEGLSVSDHEHHNLLWAIVVHKIPITMVLVSFLWASHMSKTISIIFISVFALMSPMGVMLGDEIPFFVNYHIYINAVIAGAFLHISTTILSESSKNHRFKLIQFLMMVSGIIVAFIF